MALLFMDGFDHYVTADIGKKWSTSGNVSIGTTSGRRGGGAMFGSTTGLATKNFASNEVTFIVGAAFSVSTLAATSTLLEFLDAGTVQCGVFVNLDGSFKAYRASTATVLGTTAAALVVANSFFYLEVKVTISDTVGTVELRLNGSATPVLSLTSQDTKNTANAFANSVRLNLTNPGILTVDDLYICNTSGSVNNTFLGDVRVDTLLPNGDGNYTSFTPSTGVSHYLLVDETAPNTTDYNESSTATNKDSYQMVNLGALASQTIYGVQALGAVLKDDAGARSIKVGMRSSSTDSSSAAQALSTSQLYYSNIHETDPATAVAWTESGVNAAEALFEVA